jgi:ATP-dependent Clp protease adapter protein ClpS
LNATFLADVTELSPAKHSVGWDGDAYQVVLLKDDQHSRDYVAEMLAELFLVESIEALWLAEEVVTVGRAVVLTCEWSAAEFAKRQIESYGPDPRVPGSSGSMQALVELADGTAGPDAGFAA